MPNWKKPYRRVHKLPSNTLKHKTQFGNSPGRGVMRVGRLWWPMPHHCGSYSRPWWQSRASFSSTSLLFLGSLCLRRSSSRVRADGGYGDGSAGPVTWTLALQATPATKIQNPTLVQETQNRIRTWERDIGDTRWSVRDEQSVMECKGHTTGRWVLDDYFCN